MESAVAFQGISKRFGSVAANSGVSFAIAAGSIHGVVGENGAGKSTIMKILYGMHEPDEGTIAVNDKTVRIRSPHEAIALGVGMVHQHFMLVPTLRVWQNVVLGHEGARFYLDESKAKKRLSELQAQYGFCLDLDAVIEDLPLGHRQQVEILKLLHQEARILVLDEPTAVLTPQEVEVLFHRLRDLWKSGKTIIIISHKLKEILSFTHRVTVMRHGRAIGTVATETLSEASLAEMIVGRKPQSLPSRKPIGKTTPVLEVKDLSLRAEKQRSALQGISLTVTRGEILGIAGVEGNGQTELIECLSGVRRKFEGRILLEDLPLGERKLYDTRQAGLAVIPADRHRQGLILDFAVWENYVLGHHRQARYRKGAVLSREKISPHVDKALETYDVRPRNRNLPARALSGGNQQKVILARELEGKVSCAIVAHPTRGVDIGAIEFIHSELLRLRDEGAGIVLVSSELDEILALADRIIVLFEGKIQGEVPRAAASEAVLGLWMTGGKR